MFRRRLLYEKLLAFLKCKKWFEPHWEVIWSVCRIYQATNTVTLKRASEEQTCCVQQCRYVRTCIYVGGWDLRDNHLTKKIRARPSCVPPSSRVLFVVKVFFSRDSFGLSCISQKLGKISTEAWTHGFSIMSNVLDFNHHLRSVMDWPLRIKMWMNAYLAGCL